MLNQLFNDVFTSTAVKPLTMLEAIGVALVLGLVAGPEMFVKVVIVFIVEQTIEGRFVSPLVLGSQLNIHPITILFVLITSGSMFGIWGVFLGIPVYASAKVVISALFEWYKDVSGLYEKDEIEEIQREE